MKRIHTVVAGAVAGIALAAATLVNAQPFGGMGPGFGPGMRTGPGHGPMAGDSPSVMAESRLGELKAQLKLTPAQEPSWQTFAAQAKQQAESMRAMRAKMQQSSGSAPERMEQRTTAMQERAAAMATMTKAFNALYSTLTPEQKAIADQNFGMMGPRGMLFGPRAG